jgi:hypothetical protein
MDEKDNLINIIIQCPHCQDYIIIEKLNCKIFRHGTFIKDGIQINPHSSKDNCDNYIKNNEIYGCGKPFRIKKVNNEWVLEICDYI